MVFQNMFSPYAYNMNVIQFTLLILFAYIVSAYSIHTFELERHVKNTSHHFTTGLIWVLLMNTLYLYTNQSETTLFKNPWYIITIIFTPLLYGLMVTHNKDLQYDEGSIADKPIGIASIFVGLVLFGFSLYTIFKESPEVRGLNIAFLIMSIVMYIMMKSTDKKLHHAVLFAMVALQSTTNSTVSALLGGFSAGMVCHGLVAYRGNSLYKSDDNFKIVTDK